MRLLFVSILVACCLIGCSDVKTDPPSPWVPPVQAAPTRSGWEPLAYAVKADQVGHWYQWAASLPPDKPRVRLTSSRTSTRSTGRQTSTGECGGWFDLIASLWAADQVGTACRVMLCESGGNPDAYNPSGAIGLFQLLGHGGTTDPTQNATVAFHLWESSGWSPWVCR